MNLIVLVCLSVYLVCVTGVSYQNPVLARDFPDPTVMKASDGNFYVYATQGSGVKIQVASSSDLVHWNWKGEALPQKPSWASNSNAFWAPDVQEHNSTYYMYFAATGDATKAMCIGLATSKAPVGPFVDIGTPILCGTGFTTIDPKSFDDPVTKKIYLYWGSSGIPIRVRELSPDRKSFAPGSTAIDLLQPSGQQYQHLVEAAWLQYVNNTYYLFISGDNCCGPTANYAVMVGKSNSVTGPFEYMQNATGTPSSIVLQSSSSSFVAPGHNSMIIDSAGKYWMYYHAIPAANFKAGIYDRYLLMDQVTWKNGWPSMTNSEPSSQITAGPTV